MHIVRLAHETDFEGWRLAARTLLAQGVAPENLEWRVGEAGRGLFDVPDLVPAPPQHQPYQPGPVAAERFALKEFKVPRDFIELCTKAILHSDPARFALLYRLLWRLQQQPKLLQIAFDPDVAKAQAMVKAVRRDLHKMKAFVRFREIEMDSGQAGFIAWFEPGHHIVQAAAAFFTARFTNMRWSILTPSICIHWDGETLSYTPGASKADAPTEDAGEDLWRAYYRSIFNPARLKVSAMLAQMPMKYWRNLPEAPLIAGLIADSAQRMDSMIAAQPTTPRRKVVKYIANKNSAVLAADTGDASHALRELNERMLATTEFPLAVHATQAVPGTGRAPAAVMLLGEQPGEQEDLAGQPFIGAAGKLLDQALSAAGLPRSAVYVTNALKHYKFKLQERRRLRMSPGVSDISTYQPWLQGEIAIVQPRIVVALGTVAAHAITGMALEMEANRGKLFQLLENRQAIVTYHPAFILRAQDEAIKKLRYEKLVADLRLAASMVMATG